MTPSWRKPVGMLLMLVYITVWCVIVASQWELIAALPFVLELLVYVVAGIIWIAPMRPLLSWMETGRFRPPSE